MLKLQCTCQYLVDETGYRANSIKKAVDKKTTKRHVYCSSEKILQTLIERWTRQGFGIYLYYIDIEDQAYNQKATPIDYMPTENPTDTVVWYGHQQHDFEFAKIKDN